MRSGRYLLAVVAACLLMVSTAEARSHRAHRTVAAQPTSVELLKAMQSAADAWWSAQGSPPPCNGTGTVEWGTVGEFSGHADYGSCSIMLSPHWWATQFAFVTGRYPRRARVRAAAEDLALVIHERGHNLGYRHIAGTVMQGDEQGPLLVPGWCVEWAARTIR